MEAVLLRRSGAFDIKRAGQAAECEKDATQNVGLRARHSFLERYSLLRGMYPHRSRTSII